MKKRIVMERIVKRGQDNGEFDREFWLRAGPEMRFAAAWEMVSEADLFKGRHVVKSRLQRSIQNIERRTG